MKRTKLASGIIPIDAETTLMCLGWRSKEVAAGDCWGTIGGGTKEGLTPEEGAILEMGEEVGYYGPIKLYPGFVHRRPHFEYHTFIGVVPQHFGFNPEPEYAFETDRILWASYGKWRRMMASNPETFHPGTLEAFEQCSALIEELIA